MRDRAVARGGGLPLLVVDPVMISTSGARLLDGDAPAVYRQLLPYALITTPNMAEAAILTGRPCRDRAEMADAARALCDLGVSVALVTGGHPRRGGRMRRALRRHRARRALGRYGPVAQCAWDRLHAVSGDRRGSSRSVTIRSMRSSERSGTSER